MFGHCESRHERHGKWAAGRHRGRHFGRHGMGGGGRHGMDSDDMMRAGRMLAQGDLRLVALAFIAEQPRHGYEIIKLVEEKTADWYSPSPGIIYPTLTYLEEAGYVTASTEGSKKQYAITDEGRAYLACQPRRGRCGAGTARRARRTRQPLAPLRAPRTWRRRSPQVVAAARSRDRQPARSRRQTARRRRGRRAAPGRNPRPRRDRICGGRKRGSRRHHTRVEAARPCWRTAFYLTESPACAHARAGCRCRAAGPGCGAAPGKY